MSGIVASRDRASDHPGPTLEDGEAVVLETRVVCRIGRRPRQDDPELAPVPSSAALSDALRLHAPSRRPGLRADPGQGSGSGGPAASRSPTAARSTGGSSPSC